jgi:signal peptidase I
MGTEAQEIWKASGPSSAFGVVAPAASRWRSSAAAWVRSTLRITVFFLILIVLLKGSVFEAFYVPSTSMLPTLRNSDYILVPKFMYGLRLPFVNETVLHWSSPSRGDLIVFLHKTSGSDRPLKGNLVKRVIGIEGDTVAVLGAQVLVNGEAIDEPYAVWGLGGRDLAFGPVQVPRNSVFVMGDNRDDSQDSRFWSDPFVAVNTIQGRVLLVYWSSTDVRRSGTFVR